MTVQLLPRLTAFGVSSILAAAGTEEITPALSRSMLDQHSSMFSYGASGGHRSENLALDLGTRTREIAVTCGYPNDRSQSARSRFDQEVAIFLASNSDLATGEALRDDVWSFIATVVVPDIVSWRFPDRATHRFEGGVRNALQRLWVRAVALDRGESHEDRWGLVRILSEDAAVQIFERASIAGRRRLAIALAEGWALMAQRIGREAMEPVMRRATKLLRLRNEVIDLAGLPREQLDAVVSECFDISWRSLDT